MVQREIQHDSSVIEDFLKLRQGVTALVREQVNLAARMDGVKSPQSKWTRHA